MNNDDAGGGKTAVERRDYLQKARRARRVTATAGFASPGPELLWGASAVRSLLLLVPK